MVSSMQIGHSKLTGGHQKIAWLFVATLLFLRLPFAGGIAYLIGNRPDWLDATFQIGTYLFTAVLIWWERERLTEFHIDGLAIAIIILFKPFQTILLILSGVSGAQKLPLAFPNWPSLAVWAVALGLAVALLPSRVRLPSIQVKSFSWLALCVLAGVVMAIILAYPMSFQVDPGQVGRALPWVQVLGSLAWSYPYQMGYAAVTEEPLFRGFLWGYLRQAGWKDVWIWLFQAGLFVLGHIYYLTSLPISFWIVVPTDALMLGLLAWHSRSIVTSMSAHAATNALGYTAGLIVASMRL